jgi:uncharacterized membrane protein
MEIIIFIALLIIFILIIQLKSEQKENAIRLKNNLTVLSNQLKEIKDKIEFTKQEIVKPEAVIEEKIRNEKLEAEQKAAEAYRQRIAAIEAAKQEVEQRFAVEHEIEEEVTTEPTIEKIERETIQRTPTPYVAKESWAERWIKNNPDIEKFIGENLFNKIGIAVLVFGIGFFVKYAIDQDWINEYGRVAIGFLCGIILIGFAHYLRNSYRSFSSVLAGGGIAVFYFTVAFAFHQYHIIKQVPAFGAMVIITAFAVVLSLLYNKIELAVIAAIGGFLTPFLVSNGGDNYIVLFTYLTILNVGLLALAYYKKWSLINILALFFTIIIYGSWIVKTFIFDVSPTHHANGLLFGTIFYVLFLAMNMIHNITQNKAFKAFDFFILIFINATYFTAGMVILSDWNDGNYKGLFTILLAAINFGFAFYFYKRQQADKNLLYLLIGLTLTFLSLAAPIQLSGHSITLFWSAEAVLLYWLHQRSQIKLFKLSSLLVLLLMLISLMLDWSMANTDNAFANLPIIFKDLKGVITNIVAIISLILYYILLKRDTNVFVAGFSNKIIGYVMLGLATCLVYFTLIFAINLHYTNTQTYVFANIYHRLVTNGLAVLALFIVLPRLQIKEDVFVKIGLAMFCFIFYFFSVGLISEIRIGVMAKEYKYVHLLAHFAAVALQLVLTYFTINAIRKNIDFLGKKIAALGWIFSFMVVFIFSIEFLQLYSIAFNSMANASLLQSQYEKAGLTILWSVSAFIMIWLGIKHRYKPLRIIAIVLFAIALFKLFFFDIRNISPGGKIAAFIMLGILLLAISFMYQRLKKILIDDEPKN